MELGSRGATAGIVPGAGLSCRAMGYMLVTNDDGIDSPALVPLIRAVSELGEVRTVVPSGERSWIGKAITRWHDIRVEAVKRDGLEILAVDGYPADCTNLAVHSLFDEPPDVVVSGINIGLNIGLGFFLSSGTVGAAMEGWIAGLPAIAFSTGVPDSDREWKRHATGPDSQAVWERTAALSADILSDLLEAGFPDGTDLINVNFKIDADLDTPRVVTQLAPVGYGALFRLKEPGLYSHQFAGGLRNEHDVEAEMDVAAVRRGRVSITPVQLAHTAAVPAALRRRLSRDER